MSPLDATPDRRVLEDRRSEPRPASFERRREVDTRVQLLMADAKQDWRRFEAVPVQHESLRSRA